MVEGSYAPVCRFAVFGANPSDEIYLVSQAHDYKKGELKQVEVVEVAVRGLGSCGSSANDSESGRIGSDIPNPMIISLGTHATWTSNAKIEAKSLTDNFEDVSRAGGCASDSFARLHRPSEKVGQNRKVVDRDGRYNCQRRMHILVLHERTPRELPVELATRLQ